jgi:hypothetical protein
VSKYLPWLLLLVLAALFVGGRDDPSEREREVIRETDSVYVTATDTLTVVRRRTDSLYTGITDTVIHRDTVVRIVERERVACDAVVSACEARVKARDQRIRTLEGQAGGRLFLYGEAGGGVKAGSLPVVGLELGGAFRLDRHTMVQLGATTDREIRVKVRRQIKLF